MVCCTMNNSIYQAIITKELNFYWAAVMSLIYNRKPKIVSSRAPETAPQGKEKEPFITTCCEQLLN